MSLTQMSEKLLKLTATLQNCFKTQPTAAKKEKKRTRTLSIDQLEERQLLSISPGTSTDIQINQPDPAATIPGYLGYQTQALAGGNQSSAVNDWGDFVTTWAQEEPAWMRDADGNLILDSNGNYIPYIDAITGHPVMESNIYARYFTDEVQRITLPMELLQPDNGTSKSRISMKYGGNEVQKLTFSTALEPDYNPNALGGQRIIGTFRIGGIKAHGENSPVDWVTVHFDEDNGAAYSAKLLQTALEGLGPYMKGVIVRPTNSREFEIEFANSYWVDKDVPELQIVNQSFQTGFMAGAEITTISEPIDITMKQNDGTVVGIPIYTPTARQWTDPTGDWKANSYWVTATQKTGDMIIAAFRQYWIDNWEYYAPINSSVGVADELINYDIVTSRFKAPDIAVTVINPWTYEITFINDSGKINHPELQVTSATDAGGNEYVDQDSIYLYNYYRYNDGSKPVKTVKESSDAFRVNPAEPDDPWTSGPDTTYQYKPVVAMDADGDFIIAWETEVNKPTLNRWNDWDVHAQRFTLQSVLPEDDPNLYRPDGKIIQGVKPVGSSFRVNDLDNGIQTDPTIACDKNGNFVVGWASYGQDGSYFTGIVGRWFDRDGNPLTSDISVSHEWTSTPHLPTVAMSDDGHTVFAWADIVAPGDVYKSVFLPGVYTPRIDSETVASNAYEPSIAFDSNNRYLITYTTPWTWTTNLAASPDLIEGRDIYGVMYQINAADATTPENLHRGPTRMNSTDVTGRGWVWHSQQYASSAALDADGDIFVSYQGFCPDADAPHGLSGNAVTYIPFSTAAPSEGGVGLYYENFRDGKNADIYKYMTSIYGVDPDAAIRDGLIYAIKMGASQEQLGRINALYESKATLLRGDSSGIGMTRLDADFPDQNSTTGGMWAYGFLVSDSIANNYRDGNNQKFIIGIPMKPIQSGNINLNVWRSDADLDFLQEGINIGIAVDTNAKAVDVNATMNNIRDTLTGAWVFAREYNQANTDWMYRTCQVEYYTDETIRYRDGTPWEVYQDPNSEFAEFGWHYFEVTLIGGAHDTTFDIGYNNTPGEIRFDGENNPRSTPSVIPSSAYGRTRFIDELAGTSGTGQMGSNMLVSKSGDYSVVWAQESADVSDIRYRRDINTSFIPYSEHMGIFGTSRNFVPANLFFRHFVESTDTAGPTVSDYYLPDGTHIKTGDQVTSALKSLVVVFDEEMRDVSRDAYHGVDNLKNWALLKDGVEVQNGIESIVFGLNASQPLAENAFMDSVNDGDLSRGTSKWEAVITFNETSVNHALSGGQYTLIAKNDLADVAGNVLGRNGMNKGGNSIEIVFNVTIMDGYLGFDEEEVDDKNFNSEEHVVNGSINADGSQNYVHVNDGTATGKDIDPQTGDQYFREDAAKHYPVDTDMQPGGKTVASDAEGNFAVVWASSDPGNEGIFLRKYRTRTIYGLEGKSEVEDTIDTIRLSSNPTATQPSVAMDTDGDIIVCWSEEVVIDGISNRDVYFNYVQQVNGKLVAKFTADQTTTYDYDKGGTRYSGVIYKGDNKGIVANTEREYTQQHPSVAMSNEGDFVITWESEFQDGDGWGIFAQRFAPDCSKLGGSNCVQDIMISGAPTGGTFTLRYTLYDGDTPLVWETDPITVYRNTFEMQTGIQKALENMHAMSEEARKIMPVRKLDVEVTVVSMTRILIEFVGDTYGNVDQPTLVAYNQKFTNQKEGQNIDVIKSVDGNSGEFQANLSTKYDQRFPSVGMASGGDFVITWTGWEPASGTNTLYADVYARKFVSSASLRVTSGQTTNGVSPNQSAWTPLVVSNDDPANHVVQAGSGFDGVCRIEAFPTGYEPWYGSGTLLTTGMHILTAAHVVADPLFGNALANDELIVTFDTIDGEKMMRVTQVFVHPTYAGDATFDQTSDIAVLQLEALAPSTVQRYDIYRGRDELGKTVTKVGYGYHGRAGEMLVYDDLKRMGLNTYDILSHTMDPTMHPEILMYDFDDGTVANDYFGNRYGVRNTGTGWGNEVDAAPGDSGGPGFVDQKIAGVTSGGAYYVDAEGNRYAPNGVYAFDVRVSGYADWIDAIISGGGSEFRVNQTTVGNQLWSDVAIDAAGNFVVTWTQSQINPGSIELPPAYSIMARRFDADSNPLANAAGNWGDEFLVSSDVASYSKTQHQLMSKISMTPKGDFVIAWEGLADRTDPGDGILDFDIFARRYVNSRSLMTIGANNVITGYGLVGNNGEMSSPFFINKTTAGDQRAASVALDSTGDMVFVWDGYSDNAVKKYDKTTGEEIIDNHNIMYRRITVPKDISAPYVADVVAAVKNSDTPYDYTLTQIVEGITLDTAPNSVIVTFSEEMFSRDVVDTKSILNPKNWKLYKDGYIASEAIVKIDWYRDTTAPYDPLIQGRDSAYDPAGIIDYRSGKIEIVLTFDGDLSKEGYQALQNGKYMLFLSDTVEDIMEVGARSGNRLDGNYDGLAGGNFQRTFYVGDTTVRPVDDPSGDPTKPTDPIDPTNPTYDPPAFNNSTFSKSKPAIAYRNDGGFVVVSVEERLGIDPEDPDVILDYGGLDIIARLYDKNGVAIGYERVVNNYILGDQTDPDVSMDKFGNFVVVWSGPGEYAGTSGIHARVFDVFGNPVAHSFELTTSDTNQMTPKVALNNDGTFVVTWIGYDNRPVAEGGVRGLVVYGRSFSFSGLPLGQPFIINAVKEGECFEVDVACDHNGTYYVTWTAYNPKTQNKDIFAGSFMIDQTNGQAYQLNSSNQRVYVKSEVVGGKVNTVYLNSFKVNDFTEGQQTNPAISVSGMDGKTSNFVVTWQGEGKDPKSSTITGFEVYARAFTADGTPISLCGTTSDLMINEFTKGNQLDADVSISHDGSKIVFTWASMNQELHNYDSVYQTALHDYGVYARVLTWDNSGKYIDVAEYYNQTTKMYEFQVNRTQNGNQHTPVVAMDQDGDYSIVWTGPMKYDYVTIYDPLLLIPVDYLGTNVYIRSYRPNGISTSSGSSSTTGSKKSSSGWTLGNGVSSVVSKLETAPAGNKMDGMSGAAGATVRPTGGGYGNYDGNAPTTSTTFVINGTSGNDVLSVTPGSTAGSWIIKLNGSTVNIPTGTKEVVYNGGSGNNEVQLTGTAADEEVTLNATTQTLVFAGIGLSVKADKVTKAVLDGAGGDDKINLTTSQGNDSVDISLGELIFSGTGLAYSAKNFERVSVLSGGGKDVAVLRDSKDDDYLEMSANRAIMTGKGFTHEVNGFSSITAFSQGGNDTAVLTGSNLKDVLTADENSIVLSSNNAYFNRVKGFSNVTVNGIGDGNIATIDGSSYGNDRFTASEAGAEMRYDNGRVLSFNGFQKATVNAGMGFSSALLTGGNRFVGYDDHCSYVTGNMSVTLNRFDSTVVHAQTGAASQAHLNVGGNVNATIRSLGRTTTLNEDGLDLYSLIAFDQVYAKKATGAKIGTIESAADHLFATGNWDV